MRKLLFLLFILSFLVSCNKESQITYIQEGKLKYKENYIPMSVVELDLDGNGVEEKVTLYAGPVAEIENNFSTITTDEVHWKIIVKDSDKTFPLFSKKAKVATIDFWFEKNGAGYDVVVFLNGENKEIIRYTYEGEKSRFIMQGEYKNSGDVINSNYNRILSN